MKSVKLSLNSIDKVKEFVAITATFDGDVDLVSDRYVVDAKSIMGIFSLDITKPLNLHIHNESEYDKVVTSLKDFIVE